MKKEEVKTLIEKIVNEKIQLLLNRIDTFQNSMFKNMEKLKDFDELLEINIADDFSGQSAGDDSSEDIVVLNEYVKKIAAASNQLILIGNVIEGINRFCDRAAIFLLRDDKLVGWKGKGFSGDNGQITDDDLKKVFFSLSANTVFKNVIETRKIIHGRPDLQAGRLFDLQPFGRGQTEEDFRSAIFRQGQAAGGHLCRFADRHPRSILKSLKSWPPSAN